MELKPEGKWKLYIDISYEKKASDYPGSNPH